MKQYRAGTGAYYRCILGNEQVLSWTKIRVLKNHIQLKFKKSRPLKGFSESTHQLDIQHRPFRFYRWIRRTFGCNETVAHLTQFAHVNDSGNPNNAWSTDFTFNLNLQHKLLISERLFR